MKVMGLNDSSVNLGYSFSSASNPRVLNEELDINEIKQNKKKVEREKKETLFSLLEIEYKALFIKKEYKTLIEKLLTDNLVLGDTIFRNKIKKLFLNDCDNDFNDLIEVFLKEIDYEKYIISNVESRVKINKYNNLFGLLFSVGKEKEKKEEKEEDTNSFIENFIENFDLLKNDLLKVKVLYFILEKEDYDNCLDIKKEVGKIDNKYLEFIFGGKFDPKFGELLKKLD